MPTAHHLPGNHSTLQSLPVQVLTQLEIPVLALQDTDVHEIYCVRSTSALHLRNRRSRKDWIWIQAAMEEMYGALRGRLPAKIVALLTIGDYRPDN